MVGRVIGVGLLLGCLPAAGCGTAANLARPGPEGGGKVPFGGVKHDAWCIRKAAAGEVGYGPRPPSGADPVPQRPLALLYAIDLPLSLIGDVVTWPYVKAYSFINEPVPVPPLLQAAPEARPETPLPVPAKGVPPVPAKAAPPTPAPLPLPALPPRPTDR